MTGAGLTGAERESRLDDAAALAAADPEEMLRVVASSAGQVREALAAAAEAPLDRVAADGRPRAVVTLGMGGSGIAGDVLAAVAGVGCPVPMVAHKGYGLPAWVGPVDLVTAVSCSGTTEETLSACEDAGRRGARLVAVGAAGSPLQDLCERARGVFVPVPQGRQPRASMWSLCVPLLVAGAQLGLLDADAAALEAAAVRLEDVAVACRPDAETLVNPAKTLATGLLGALPLLWGTTPLTATAAYRACCQLNENAKSPAVPGALPEADHNQVVAFEGPFGALRGTAGDPGDFFRDRAGDAEGTLMRLVLLRDDEADEHPQVVRRAAATADVARQRGVDVTVLQAAGESRVERLASLVGLLDFASVYLGLLHGVDPTPVRAIEDLKARIR